jgi:hypothetical protein
LISGRIFFLLQCCVCSTRPFRLSCANVFGQSVFESSPVTTDPLVRPTPQPEIARGNNGEPPAASSPEQPATGAAHPDQTLNTRPDQGSFWWRLITGYADDWKPLAAGPGASSSRTSAPAFRGDPAPVNGPPFPFSTWPIGGTVSIGQPWTQAGPLMTALWSGPHGDTWKNSKIQIYGWLNVGGKLQHFESWSESVGGEVRQFPHGLR